MAAMNDSIFVSNEVLRHFWLHLRRTRINLDFRMKTSHDKHWLYGHGSATSHVTYFYDNLYHIFEYHRKI